MPIAADVNLAEDVQIFYADLVNIYGCTIGSSTSISPFVEIQRGVVIGARCKISSHAFLCQGVMLDDEVFVGHGVMFTNDRYPRATNSDGTLQTALIGKYSRHECYFAPRLEQCDDSIRIDNRSTGINWSRGSRYT
jgi:hypothetical protein